MSRLFTGWWHAHHLHRADSTQTWLLQQLEYEAMPKSSRAKLPEPFVDVLTTSFSYIAFSIFLA